MRPSTQVLHVWGELACFSRPALKVERFSYPIITPSAARGIFDAIYCKPVEFRWQITMIEALSPPSYIALRRNEVKDKVSVKAVAAWMAGKAPLEPLWADGDRDLLGTDKRGRTQRQTMALRDASYRLYGNVVPWPGHEEGVPAVEAQFRRRVTHGKCFTQPSFGCREFPAFFELAGGHTVPPVSWTQDLGWMLYDVFDLSRVGGCHDRPAISIFRARVENGALRVPEYGSPDVLKVASGGA